MIDDWKMCNNILLIRLDSMGDVLMTVPAFTAVRQSIPHASLSLLTSSSGEKIARLIPELNDVMPFNAPWVRNKRTDDVSAIIKELSQRKFDGAIIFTVYSQNPLPSALVSLLAGIPRRLAYCHENPYDLLTTWIPDPEPAKGIRHEVERQLHLVEKIGCTTNNKNIFLPKNKNCEISVKKKLSAMGILDSRPWLVVHPGASEEIRKYSKEEMITLLQILSYELGYQLVLTGSAEEIDYVEDIILKVGDPSCVSLAGVLSVAELIELIRLAPLLVTNNTGPAHIASATKTQEIVLYATTNPQHTPWKVSHTVFYFSSPCKGCERNVCPGNHRVVPFPTPQVIAEEVYRRMQYVSNAYEKSINTYTNF